MIGPRGVGKTSMLAGMYDQFERTCKDLQLELSPDLITSQKLQDQVSKLKTQASESYDATYGGIEGTSEEHEFKFEIGTIGEEPDIEIKFKDFPGGWLKEDNKLAKVADFIAKSQMVLVAIDTPALMERNGKYNDEINATRQVCDFLKKIPQKLEHTKLILFVPIKCESYVQTDRDANNLMVKIQEAYDSSFRAFQTKEQKIITAITPIQTIGNIRFNVFTKNADGQILAKFKAYGDGSYKPQDVEQPLLFLLSFLICEQTKICNDIIQKCENQHGIIKSEIDGRSLWKRMMDYVTGGSNEKKREMNKLQQEIKDGKTHKSLLQNSVKNAHLSIKNNVNGFKIVQGSHLLGK